MENIVILGGGLGGFYVAKGLEKQLKRGEAQVTLVDARCACTYQPFLAEVVSGCIEPRHVLTPLRRHLPRTDVVQARVEAIDSAARQVTGERCGTDLADPLRPARGGPGRGDQDLPDPRHRR